jgi:F-type H+-transporting ATPase subunit b
MFQLDLTYFIFLGMFLLFIKALNDVYLKPMGQVIAKRQEIIKNDIDAAARCQAEAAERISQYEKELHDIRLQAQAIITEQTTQTQQRRNQEMKRVMDEGQAKLAVYKKQIEAERAGLMAGLVEEEKTIVQAITHKLLGESVRVSLDSATVERALQEAR